MKRRESMWVGTMRNNREKCYIKVHEKKEGQQVGPVCVMIVTKPEETWLYPQDSYW